MEDSRMNVPKLAGAVFVLLLTTTGCSTIFAVKGEQRLADANAMIAGTVAAEKPSGGPLVVALFTRGADDYRLVDYFTVAKPDSWVFGVQPGTYWVAAFEDRNSDGAYEDEPFFRPDPEHPFVVTAGQHVTGVNIVIPVAGRALKTGHLTLRGMMARDEAEQQIKSIYALSKLGEITTLDDPRFAETIAEAGMWKFYDFLIAGRAGIYFLEPYDPKRIPVLFVHGINGTPRNFTTLIGKLDRKRFQPWVVYYPSGGRLDNIVSWLDQLYTRLEVTLHFETAVVVAHSMGGLVSRGFVLRHHQTSAKDPIRMFVTISSPLGGMESAGEGVETSPIVVRSWYGLAPGSPYLESLFYDDPATHLHRRRLPDTIAYHMLFGFKGGGRSGASDGVVRVASQLRPEAQEEALSIRGYDETHAGILESAAAAAHLNEVLAQVH
jgi:pimeloyl-ACP methyl ester carboxylesterase